MEEKYELTDQVAMVVFVAYKDANGEYVWNEERGPEFYRGSITYPTLLIPPKKNYDERSMDTVVHRIRALRDIPEIGVKAGDLGGFIEDEGNLSHYGTCWVHDNAVVYDNGHVQEDAQVRGSAVIEGGYIHRNAEVSEKALVTYGADIGWDAKIYGSAVVYRGSVYSATIHGDACVISPFNQDTFSDRDVATGNWIHNQLIDES